MKLVEGVLNVLLWVALALVAVFFGWCLKGYQVRRNNAE